MQLKDWGSLCNFVKPAHFWGGEEGKKERRKFIARAPLCLDSWHMPTHYIKGGTMLQTLPWKATNSNPPGDVTYTVQRMQSLFYQKTKTLLTHTIIAKTPLDVRKKSWSQGLFSNYTVQKDMRIQKCSLDICCLFFFQEDVCNYIVQ